MVKNLKGNTGWKLSRVSVYCIAFIFILLSGVGIGLNYHDKLQKAIKKEQIISQRVKNWIDIKFHSTRLGIPPELVATVQVRETGYLPFNRRDTEISYAGAIGLHQIMPFHAEDYGYKVSDLKNPKINTMIACIILKQGYVKYHKDIGKTLAYYNGGDGQARKPQNKRCRETRNYVLNGLNTYKYFTSFEK